jgi:hypothetical protein
MACIRHDRSIGFQRSNPMRVAYHGARGLESSHENNRCPDLMGLRRGLCGLPTHRVSLNAPERVSSVDLSGIRVRFLLGWMATLDKAVDYAPGRSFLLFLSSVAFRSNHRCRRGPSLFTRKTLQRGYAGQGPWAWNNWIFEGLAEKSALG